MTPKYLTVHCSATPPTMDIGANEIRSWHVNDNGWSDIGYHFVIRRDGKIEPGRPLDRQGAHVGGHNKDNVGVCLIGGTDAHKRSEDNFTDEQFSALRHLMTELQSNYGIKDKDVKGHRDWPGVAKSCPSFDVNQKRKEWEG